LIGNGDRDKIPSVGGFTTAKEGCGTRGCLGAGIFHVLKRVGVGRDEGDAGEMLGLGDGGLADKIVVDELGQRSRLVGEVLLDDG